MPSRVLPVEVCARIVRYAAEGDLPALCRTSKLFQDQAEPRVYQHITLRDPRLVTRICGSLLARDGRRALYVRRLWICIEIRPYTRGPIPEQYWRLISDIFPKADNLEYLYVADPEACRPWLVDPASVHFQLRDASLHLVWDKLLVAFLQTQKHLQFLAVNNVEVQRDINGTPRRTPPISPDGIPGLTSFDGPLEVATELLSRPLRDVHTQLGSEDGDVLLTFLSKAARSSKSLRNFDAYIVPEYLVCDALRILAESPLSVSMCRIGILALPLNEVQRCDIHRSLLKFTKLETLRLDLTHWEQPVPMLYVQRMVASELRIYCPSIRFIVFWHGHHQFTWRCEDEQWSNIHTGERRFAQDTSWRI